MAQGQDPPALHTCLGDAGPTRRCPWRCRAVCISVKTLQTRLWSRPRGAVSAEGQPVPSPSRFRLCGRRCLRRGRKGRDPGQTGSAPSANRPSVAAGRADGKPSTRPGAASSLTRSQGHGAPGAGSAGAGWGKSFPESAVSGGRLDPQGARPRRPSGRGGHPPPRPTLPGPRRFSPGTPNGWAQDGSAPDTPRAPPGGLTFPSEKRTTLPRS